MFPKNNSIRVLPEIPATELDEGRRHRRHAVAVQSPDVSIRGKSAAREAGFRSGEDFFFNSELRNCTLA